MEVLLKAGEWVLTFGPELISALVLILTGVAGVAMMVPGDEPEKTLKAIAEWLAKFSRK